MGLLLHRVVHNVGLFANYITSGEVEDGDLKYIAQLPCLAPAAYDMSFKMLFQPQSKVLVPNLVMVL